MKNASPVIVISGPTASGKTSTSLELASRFGGEIVNFDSLLLYKEINIGTAKPTLEEQKKIPHHMLNVRSIAEPMNAADYASEALKVVESLLQAGKIVYLVGGSGFYLQALLKGMYDSPSTPLEITQRSDKLYAAEGIKPFLEILRSVDPETFARYHENDHYRVRRAVEHWWSNGTKLSDERKRKDSANQEMRQTSVHDWNLLHIHLDLPKEEHLHIIEKRTRSMLELGLYDEVKALLAQGFTGLEKPLQSIGYKEMLDLHFGVHKTLKECEERIIISTRQLAKSQRTWFKRDNQKLTFHPVKQKEDIFRKVQEHLKSV